MIRLDREGFFRCILALGLTIVTVSVYFKAVARYVKAGNGIFDVFLNYMKRTGAYWEFPVTGETNCKMSVPFAAKLIYGVIFSGKNVLCYYAGLFKSQKISVYGGNGIHFLRMSFCNCNKNVIGRDRSFAPVKNFKNICSLACLLDPLRPVSIYYLIVGFGVYLTAHFKTFPLYQIATLNTSRRSPATVPIKNKRMAIFKFSFLSSFTLNNTKRPMPAPTKRPDIIVPKVII